jgi:hypothetical protein
MSQVVRAEPDTPINICEINVECVVPVTLGWTKKIGFCNR